MIESYLYLLVTIIGLIIGSFLNTLIFRFPITQGIITHKDEIHIYHPRSFCPNCNKMIPFYFNIPLLSFILLKGRCFFCSHKISFTYPFVELLNASFYLIFYLLYGLSYEFIFYSLVTSLLIPISFIDLKYRIIPNSLILFILLLGISFSFVNPYLSVFTSIAGAVMGFLIFYLMSSIYLILKKEEGLGVGDAKLLAAVGSFVGIYNIPIIIFITSIVGLVSGLVFYVTEDKKEKFLKTSIPLAPSISLSFLLFFLFIS